MSITLALLFPMATSTGPIDISLRSTEAPETMRAAFTVEMVSGKAERTYQFDPRLPVGERWKMIDWKGEDSALDEAAAAWGGEAAPDGRLFPDDLRASFGRQVEVDDLGSVWRVRFRHTPSANDGALDIWAAQRLEAEAWLEPEGSQFLRIDYRLNEPVRGPEGGRLTAFNQSYLLESEPIWGLTYVSHYKLEFEAKAAFRTIRQNYQATITKADFFFSSVSAEDQYVEQQFQAGARFAAR